MSIAVAGVARRILDWLILAVTKEVSHLGDCFLYYGHLRSLRRGTFLPIDRSHKNSYTL